MTLQTGQPAPDFELRDQHGRFVSLASFGGRRAVLLVFYPFAFSGVCTSELRALRDGLPNLDPDKVQLLAVSCDPMFSLRAFADTDGLQFPLLSDFWPHGAVSSVYGVLDFERGCPTRSSFVIDAAGRIRWQVHSPRSDARSVEEYLRILGDL